MTACDNYVVARYLPDLAAFRSSYARVLGRTTSDVGATRRRVVHILEGHTPGVARAVREAKLDDPLRFLIVTFLEAALSAGVHSYDRPRHTMYLDALPFEVFVECYPSMTMLHPQSVLAAHPKWSRDDLLLLRKCVASLAARWAAIYDRVIARAPGAGRRVLAALAHDRDLGWGAAAEIEEHVAAGYMAGFRDAAQSGDS